LGFLRSFIGIASAIKIPANVACTPDFKTHTHKITTILENNRGIISTVLIVVFLGVLGIMLRLFKVYDMGTWDEGWYSNITYIMHQTKNWLVPIYYRDTLNSYFLFDKPPLAFIIGSFEIDLFGFSSLAAKFSMGFFSGLMGIAAYFIYSNQKEGQLSSIAPEMDDIKQQNLEITESFNEEIKSEKTNGQVTGVIFGLSMAVAWFLIFYGRTAYLDPIVVAFTAFTALFAIRAIDYWFYGNHKKAYIYLILTAIFNMTNLLLKSWQGLIVGPSIALYLFIRYYERFVPKTNLCRFVSNMITSFSSNFILNLVNIL
jgi:uncharacterized membrane protein (UPF0136 family)